MKRKVWTASAPCCGIVLFAQCKGGKTELIRRLIADDPLWGRGFELHRERRWPSKKFRRGLAFLAR